jgi:hypothetical protein
MAVDDSWVCANQHVNPEQWLICKTCNMPRTGAGQAVRCQLGHLNPAGTRVCNSCSGPIGVVSAYCTRGHYIGTGSKVCRNCGSGPSTLHTYGGGARSSSEPPPPLPPPPARIEIIPGLTIPAPPPTAPLPPPPPEPPPPLPTQSTKPTGGASWQRQPDTASQPASTPSVGSGKKPLMIILGAIVGVSLLAVIGSKIADGGSGSSDSPNGAAGSQYPTDDTPASAPIPPSTDDDWKAAVCRPGYYSDRSAILPNADWSASCQSMRGNPIIMGWYSGSFSVRNDLAMFRGATFAQLPTSDGRTAIFLTPVRGTGGALEPLTQFGFTLGAVS